jgi:hypothetical protein
MSTAIRGAIPMNAAHIHIAPRHIPGPVIVPLATPPAATNGSSGSRVGVKIEVVGFLFSRLACRVLVSHCRGRSDMFRTLIRWVVMGIAAANYDHPASKVQGTGNFIVIGTTPAGPLYLELIEPDPSFAAFRHCPRLAG